jgi:hypothetical protein
MRRFGDADTSPSSARIYYGAIDHIIYSDFGRMVMVKVHLTDSGKWKRITRGKEPFAFLL